jgi:hypothetical protein
MSNDVINERERILDAIRTEGRQLVLDALEQGSMAWTPRPVGKFNSETATLHANRLLTKLEILIKEGAR